MKDHRKLLVLIISLFALLIANFVFAQEKRVAVFDFEDKTDGSWHWWHGKGVGYGMTDMLVTALVKSDKFRVFERDALDKIMQEQKLGLSGLVTEQTAAQVGKLLGVQFAILGSVTELGYKKGGVGGRLKGIRVGVNKYDAVVAVDVRIVNTETAEILLSESVRKAKSKSGIGVSTPKLDFSSQNKFDDSLVGKATREAIEEVVKILDKNTQPGELVAKVIKVDSGGNVIINKGSIAGVKVKDILYVYRKGEDLIDPDTGLSLGSEMEKIGTIRVVADMLEGKASKAEVIKGNGFEGGDFVKRN
jgi:curli biogenesis system outer membrane secretion channel CsgG